MTDELQELHENAEHAHHNPSMAPISSTMAFLAVLVATATLLGHRAHTEEVMKQADLHDQWSFYQAKNIRQHEDELFMANSAAAAPDFRDKIAAELKRYAADKDQIHDKAHELEAEVQKEGSRADRYDWSEVLLEIALVITSITLLSGRKIFWYSGMAIALFGVGMILMGALVH
jgi:hypothetical protein